MLERVSRVSDVSRVIFNLVWSGHGKLGMQEDGEAGKLMETKPEASDHQEDSFANYYQDQEKQQQSAGN